MSSPKVPDAASFTEWNEQMVTKYDPEAYHLRSPVMIRWITRRRVRAIAQLLDATASSRVIEIGCGAGNILEHLSGRFKVGIDLSARMVARAKERLAAVGGTVVRGGAERLPFASGSFDRVVCSEVLEHLREPEAALHEMFRILAPGGIIVVSVPNEPLIDRLKGLVMFARADALMRGSGYKAPDKMTEEWHLHAFDLQRAKALVPPDARLLGTLSIPGSILPLHYVLALQRR